MSEYINNIRFDAKKAENFFAQRLAYTLGPVELSEMMKEGKVKLIDVRYPDDFVEGHIPFAVSMPKIELAQRLSELSKKELHVVYCYNQQCHLASSAALILAKNGYPVMELEGGFDVWKNGFKFDVEK
ncbi:MAG TPA: rhodanese-like domain-containing protein [Candidatus Gastranaerophilaceae bacterium]|nr:rhodanese-like domain-containing protein [Candidatus Gastranaerophilaceae bacterium]HPT41082.1 rhodanese-like domain-containing protein [Candidatus Gastranaerophilaceae bacterium]